MAANSTIDVPELSTICEVSILREGSGNMIRPAEGNFKFVAAEVTLFLWTLSVQDVLFQFWKILKPTN